MGELHLGSWPGPWLYGLHYNTFTCVRFSIPQKGICVHQKRNVGEDRCDMLPENCSGVNCGAFYGLGTLLVHKYNMHILEIWEGIPVYQYIPTCF